MKKISIRNLGPIKEADIEFGDLTILVGPQASGKSILLQMVKLFNDKNVIFDRLKKHGYVWSNANDFLELFFGEGMSQIWSMDTSVVADSEEFHRESLLFPIPETKQTVFYIPAQRVIALQNGWPRPFSDYGNEPYVLKGFSEALRVSIENKTGQLLKDISKSKSEMYESVYYEGNLDVDVQSHRKRFVLDIEGSKIPYMAWSAGQREFMPLWLGLYVLLGTYHSEITKVVIVEEPEMGLHPAAIKKVIIALLELVRKGYKVIISTHSPIFLEFAWAFQFLHKSGVSDKALYELFDIPTTEAEGLFDGIMTKQVNTYYFDRKEDGSVVKNISSLDAGSDDPLVAEWGGLSSFASKAGEIVAKYGPEE